MKTRVTRTPDGYRDVWAWSQDRAELDRLVQTAARRGELVGSMFRQTGDGWELAARLHAAPYQRPSAQLPPAAPVRRTPRIGWTLTLRRPELTGRLALVGGGLGVVAGLVWLLWQATTGAAQWATEQAGWLIPLGVLALVAVGAWLTRDRSGKACGGMAHHCPRCPDH